MGFFILSFKNHEFNMPLLSMEKLSLEAKKMSFFSINKGRGTQKCQKFTPKFN